MKTKLFLLIFMTLLTAVLFTACQPGPAALGAAAGGGLPPVSTPTNAADELEEAPAAQPTLAPQPTIPPTPTEDPEQARKAAAEQAVQTYFTAVAEGKTDEAADLLSSFSLMVFQMTRGDAAAELQARKIEGARWSDLEIIDTQAVDAETVLVQVSYTETKKAPADGEAAAASADAKATTEPQPTPQTVEALWPIRLERGEWRYNWNNLIDFRTLDTDPETMNGITMMPVQMNRYSDRVQLILLVQNRTNEAVVFGQINETLGTFHFGDQAVVAEQTQWILNPLRSVPGATLEVKGLFESYPDTVEIRKWNSYDVAPWYVFQLQ